MLFLMSMLPINNTYCTRVGRSSKFNSPKVSPKVARKAKGKSAPLPSSALAVTGTGLPAFDSFWEFHAHVKPMCLTSATTFRSTSSASPPSSYATTSGSASSASVPSSALLSVPRRPRSHNSGMEHLQRTRSGATGGGGGGSGGSSSGSGSGSGSGGGGIGAGGGLQRPLVISAEVEAAGKFARARGSRKGPSGGRWKMAAAAVAAAASVPEAVEDAGGGGGGDGGK